MSETNQTVFGAVAMVLIGMLVAGPLGYALGERDSRDRAGSIACHSINKTWALIDGQYMCVTVTE